jgi:hypothetical protein
MAWIWSSWEEFTENVRPVVVDSIGRFNLTHRSTWFDIEQGLFEALNEINDALNSLKTAGFKGSDDKLPPSDQLSIDEARGVVIELIHGGELLLLHHKRLAKSDFAYGFLHQHDISEHWDSWSIKRLSREIDQLVRDTHKLLEGYYQIKEFDDQFLLFNLDLPVELEFDFRLARNLFSVGFDDVGVLIAGRGLEGVLRKIA